MYCSQARPCIFQPGNCTGWGSEGVGDRGWGEACCFNWDWNQQSLGSTACASTIKLLQFQMASVPDRTDSKKQQHQNIQGNSLLSTPQTLTQMRCLLSVLFCSTSKTLMVPRRALSSPTRFFRASATQTTQSHTLLCVTTKNKTHYHPSHTFNHPM